MKKGTKGMLIAAGAFAVAGIGFCIGGISVAAVETGGNVRISEKSYTTGLEFCLRLYLII